MNTDMEMPAEVDFSDSVPNPYIGKVRRRVTMNTDMNNENGKIVEGKLMKRVEDFRAGRLETVTLDELEENLELTKEDDTQCGGF